MKLIIDIKVTNLQRAVEFYTKVLNLPCRVVQEQWAGISVGDAEIHLYTGGGATGHVEFYVEHIEDMVRNLHTHAVEFVSGLTKPEAISEEHHITTFPWGKTCFFKDSEGNELAIVQDFPGN